MEEEAAVSQDQPPSIAGLNLSNILGIIGIIFYIMITLSPAPIFINAIKKKELIHNYDLIILLASASSAGILLCYGIKISDVFLCICYLFGYIIYLVYTNTLLFLENETNSMLKYTSSLIIITLTIWILIPHFAIGVFLTIFNILYCYTKLNKIKDDLKNKKSEYLTQFVVISNFCCNLAWFIYGCSKRDVFISICFMISLLLWIVNVFIFYWIQGIISDENIAIALLRKALIGDDVVTNQNLDNYETDTELSQVSSYVSKKSNKQLLLSTTMKDFARI